MGPVVVRNKKQIYPKEDLVLSKEKVTFKKVVGITFAAKITLNQVIELRSAVATEEGNHVYKKSKTQKIKRQQRLTKPQCVLSLW